KGIGRALARRPAAEVGVGDQDARLVERRAVEDEARLLAHVVEQELAVAVLARELEKPRRDDAIGVDVDRIVGRRDRRQFCELFHHSLRTSVRWPAIAAAAAIAGLMRWVRAPLP